VTVEIWVCLIDRNTIPKVVNVSLCSVGSGAVERIFVVLGGLRGQHAVFLTDMCELNVFKIFAQYCGGIGGVFLSYTVSCANHLRRYPLLESVTSSRTTPVLQFEWRGPRLASSTAPRVKLSSFSFFRGMCGTSQQLPYR